MMSHTQFSVQLCTSQQYYSLPADYYMDIKVRRVFTAHYIYVERIYGYAMKIYGVNGNVKAGKGS